LPKRSLSSRPCSWWTKGHDRGTEKQSLAEHCQSINKPRECVFVLLLELHGGITRKFSQGATRDEQALCFGAQSQG
jgi:hypothetical protein